jgi:hypothetical protein
MVQVPPGHGPGSTFAVRVPGPPVPPPQPVLVQPTVVAPGMPVPPQPTPAQNYAALAAANAPPPQTAPLPTPKGPCLLVDHLDRPGDAFIPLGSMSLGADRGGQAFAGYIADDMDGAGAKPAFAAVISTRDWQKHCPTGQDVPQGLVVPIYPSAIDQKGQIEWTGAAVAELHLDKVAAPACKCNDPLSAKVTKDGKTYEIVSESGRCMRLCVCIPCQPCFADSDMTLGEGAAQVRLKGAKTKPCCDCNRYDTTVFRSVQGEAAAGMHRATLVNEAVGCSKATRKLVRHKRRSGVVLGGLGSVDGLQGTVTGSQAYSIRLPAKNALPPEVWFAATIFEMIAYPYHKMRVEAYHDPLDIHGGAPSGMEMTR